MSEPLAALRAGAAALLDAAAERRLAAAVRSAEVELAGSERWAMGSREVTAHRVALVLSAEALLALSDENAFRAVRSAFAQAMRSPDTELLDLHLELRLPGVERPWARAYRDAPQRNEPPEHPPEAVVEGAAALLDAMGERAAAAIMRRATLEMASIPSAVTPLTRCVLRLPPEDRARAASTPGLEERLLRALQNAAVRAGETLAIEIGVTVA